MPDRTLQDVLGDAAPAFSLAYLRSSKDCVMVLNVEGRISFISDNGRDLLEIPDLGVVVGRALWDFVPGGGETFRENFARARAGELRRFPARVETYGGTPVDWDITIAPVINLDGATESVLAIWRVRDSGGESG